MRLGLFIKDNMEAILVEWEAFAVTLYPPSSPMTPLKLRDHAKEILAAVVEDLSQGQTDAQQSEKSKGRAPQTGNEPDTAAETHAVLRAESGMDINQLAAEYRALRASVLRLWEDRCQPGAESLQDVIRFNEAIDQALAESIDRFSKQIDRYRNLLLGMLGHDMRNPLNAIVMTASSLAELDLGEDVSEAAACLVRSGASMKELLDDLVDFNRTTLGLGIQVEVKNVDLGALFADEVSQHEAANPSRKVLLTIDGNVRGRVDGGRLQQVLRNLISNANAYGSNESPIEVALDGRQAVIQFEVRNKGPVIDAATAEYLFDPMKRGNPDDTGSNRQGLGLGLYIVREIVKAHGGEIELRSQAGETVFTVRLPRTCGGAKSGAE